MSDIATSRGLQPLADVLRGVAAAWPEYEAVAAIDSALHTRQTTRAELRWAFAGSERAIHCLARSDPRAESGTESIARIRFADAGIDCDLQVQLTPEHRVDLFIDGWLAVEIDSKEHHDNPKQYARDRRRDAELTRQELRVLRFGYDQVVYDWSSVLEATRAALRVGNDILAESG